jgi:hypothetical protein
LKAKAHGRECCERLLKSLRSSREFSPCALHGEIC